MLPNTWRPRPVLFSAAAALTLAIASPRSAAACECLAPGDPCQSVKQKHVKLAPEPKYSIFSAVFVGRVLSRDASAPPTPTTRFIRFRFAVSEVLSGRVPRTVDVTEEAANCMFPFRIGEEYLVYAYDSPEGLMTSICSRTGELSRRRHDVEILRALRSGKPQTRFAGSVSRMERRLGGPPYAMDAVSLPGIRVTVRRGTFVRDTTTDERGEFLFNVFADGRRDPKRPPVWYPNADTPTGADVIEVPREGQRIVQLRRPASENRD